MNTSITTSRDGTRIAFDCCGAGPAVILLHGGGGRRQEWHDVGYVKRLQDDFTVITLDLRGHGESATPVDPADYTLEKQAQDVLAVADACGAERFTLVGMSHGGKVGRHLAILSGRVDKFILMSAPLGPGASSQLRQEILAFVAHWTPIAQSQLDGTLNLDVLSQNDREFLQNFNVAAMLGWGPAMLDWPPVEPADFRCPMLWLAGAEDQGVMESVREYEKSLAGSQVQVQVFAGFSHEQVFEQIDAVFPSLLSFAQKGVCRVEK